MTELLENINQKADQFAKKADRPVIGISANRKDGLSCIAEPYFQSVVLAGGAPVIVPVTTDIEALAAVVESLDGLIFSGGGDIDPAFLGEEPIPELDGVDAYRDQFDFLLLRLAFNRQIPIFGICRGHQMINVAFGGTMYQDIKTQFPAEPLNHSQSEPREIPTHYVDLTDKDKRLYVNSVHHQAVKDVAPGFVETAKATDGVNEGIERAEHQIFAVQWHPEQLAAVGGDTVMLQLFERIVDNARMFKRAKFIHSNIYSIDSHTDTPMFLDYGYDLGKKNILTVPSAVVGQKSDNTVEYSVKVDVAKMREGLCDAVAMAAYIPQGERNRRAHQAAAMEVRRIIHGIQKQIKNNESIVAQAVTPDDIRKNKAAGKKSVIIAIENGYGLGNKLSNLSYFAQMGVVYITLVHNGNNDICDSAIGEPEHNGLSEFGRKVVAEMNRCGVIIDISHASEKTALDVLELSKFPVIASHSSVNKLCPHRRNLSLRLMRRIAARGGVIQVCLFDRFLRREGKATVSDVADHIDYIVDKVGIDHVGIGSDFDGCDSSAGLTGINEYPRITLELIRRGYSDEAIGKIWGGNFMRVMGTVQSVRDSKS
ncbi:MAG: membrane dipeptidase [Tannerella sp.]|jgi:microsomal dipeptidase-like Zn-dependent dipeptidase/gamma-glutamyl-gamma-aminobutyrate hydrolase PuuD|nr:membrane dipeptidase [Tannerella sp.]